MLYYLNRIFNNKIKLCIFLILFLLPVLDVIITLIDIHAGASVPLPDLAAFLGSSAMGPQGSLFLWYLPMYLAVIVSDDCIEDYKLGYKNLLISKWGKNKYFSINMIKSFIVSFLIIFIPLIFNLVMVHIAYAGGTYYFWNLDDLNSIPSMVMAMQNPLLTNIIYILLVSFLSGVLGTGSTAIAIAFHNRFVVYPIVFILWDIATSIEHTIMYAIQPFTEYFMQHGMQGILFVLITSFAAIVFAFVKVKKYDQV